MYNVQSYENRSYSRYSLNSLYSIGSRQKYKVRAFALDKHTRDYQKSYISSTYLSVERNITMLKLTRRILDSELSAAVRCLSSSAPLMKPVQTQSSADEEEVFRPAAAQADSMTDMGTRTLFTPEHDMFR